VTAISKSTAAGQNAAISQRAWWQSSTGLAGFHRLLQCKSPQQRIRASQPRDYFILPTREFFRGEFFDSIVVAA
jgi:hypothetical protein